MCRVWLQEELLTLVTNNISTDNDMHVGSVAAKDFVTVTFRIDKKVIENLRNESETSGISLNAAVNQILHHYAEWDSFAQRVGMLPFPKAVLRNIFAEMNDDQITKLASSVGKNTAMDMAIFMKGRIDVLGFISWIESRMRNSGFEIVHRIDSYKEAHTLVIKHDLGKNWSLYLKILLESILADFFKKQSESIVTDSMLSINFSFGLNKV